MEYVENQMTEVSDGKTELKILAACVCVKAIYFLHYQSGFTYKNVLRNKYFSVRQNRRQWTKRQPDVKVTSGFH